MADPQSNAAVSAHPVPFDIPADAPRAGVIRVRHRHRDRFTVVGNHLAQHPKLSAAAIGIAVHIQSLPDGADVTVKRLTLRFREGEITVRRALNELVAAGYLERRRVALGGGRFATRVISYDRPGTTRDAAATSPPPRSAPVRESSPAPVRERPAPPPVTPPSAAPPSPPPASEVAAAVLARLRTVDPRLLLSWRDVRELAPAVDTWLGQGVGPEQVTRTLTAALPPEHVPIHQPARFLAYRLDSMLPPPLPAEVPEPPRPTPPARPPLVSCDGCERAIRTYDEKPMCADCRQDAADAAGAA
ncbi:hypothetical protein [Streptomyces sp. NPDC004267]|uniref:hypothetical protein n=1 Tax=Streptomyces sp. NPDC004267 TaxID=3364694 RepID=UPI0036A8A787